jgi:hypothetical protein
VPYVIPESDHKYIPDFVLPKRDGTDMLIETKGELTLDNRKKHLLIKNQYPEIDIRFIFQRAINKIRPGSKTTYAIWAEKNGFQWADKKFPDVWLKEVKFN